MLVIQEAKSLLHNKSNSGNLRGQVSPNPLLIQYQFLLSLLSLYSPFIPSLTVSPSSLLIFGHVEVLEWSWDPPGPPLFASPLTVGLHSLLASLAFPSLSSVNKLSWLELCQLQIPQWPLETHLYFTGTTNGSASFSATQQWQRKFMFLNIL